jgi:ribonucleotide reductase alpha subunit
MYDNKQYPQMYDWQSLKDKVKKYGTANSLLTALMPTATTSQILGNNECFEPYSSNIYKRTTLAGEFQVINKHLVNKLIELNLWNENMKNAIIKDDGSIQNIPNISPDIKNVFKTIWEIKQKEVIDHALARAPYVDQSQSMNLFFSKPNFTNLYSALMYGWKNGLKTGCYYLRSKPATEAIKYGLQESEVLLCSLANKDECKMCSA